MKLLPIGIENFKELIDKNYYYVDKTNLIANIINEKVVLYTRPRRFGKTLNMSMLYYFFSIKEKDNAYLFDCLNISKNKDALKHQNKYPTIFISLKEMKNSTFDAQVSSFGDIIKNVILQNKELLESVYVDESDRVILQDFRFLKGTLNQLKYSLKTISRCLYNHYHQKVIILIDEYDVPLEGAFVHGFYDRMVGFIRGFFENTLKTNDSLNFAVITGCLRVSKESIFTGLNNLRINSVLSDNYGEYFGFTEDEVKKICDDYGMPQKYPEIKEWYNGYIFGNKNVYNPWSSIYYVSDHLANINAYPKSYWVNTSSNSIVRDLIEHADDVQKDVIGDLIADGTITVPVHEDITYGEVYDSMDNLWNFMFFTGYFKKVSESFDEEKDQIYITIKIVNREVRYIFINKVDVWFRDKIKETDRSVLFSAIVSGNVQIFTEELNKLLHPVISYHDYSENYYHGFLAGILTGMSGFVVRSNREAGNGRSDLFIKPISRFDTAYVLELKVADDIEELESKGYEAIKQIIARKYEDELREDGYKKIERYGIAFYKKDCMVVKG